MWPAFISLFSCPVPPGGACQPLGHRSAHSALYGYPAELCLPSYSEVRVHSYHPMGPIPGPPQWGSTPPLGFSRGGKGILEESQTENDLEFEKTHRLMCLNTWSSLWHCLRRLWKSLNGDKKCESAVLGWQILEHVFYKEDLVKKQG